MTGRSLATFDAATFLSKAGIGRRVVQLKTNEPFFSQGDKGVSEKLLSHALDENRIKPWELVKGRSRVPWRER